MSISSRVASLSILITAPVGLMIFSPAAAQNSSSQCSWIGRLQQGESTSHRQNSLVCNGAEIVNPVGAEFFCFSNRVVVPLTGTTTVDSAFCTQSAESINSSEAVPCNTTARSPRSLCVISKGPEDRRQFSVLQPDVVSGPRPQIVWEEVANADTYTIYVSGLDISWQRTISATAHELAYPQGEDSLSSGVAYQVLVTASSDTEQVATSIPKTINVSGTAQRVELQLAARTNGAQ